MMAASVVCYSLSTMQPTAFPASSVLALGNFDGVHLGHQALLSSTKELCLQHAENAVCGVFSFSTPSTEYFSPAPHRRLSTLKERLALFRDCGMEYAYIADFSEMRETSPKEFVDLVLKDTCRCKGAVCGYNFHFGKGGSADGEQLSRLADFPVLVCKEISYDGSSVSSTRIRELLVVGEVDTAALLLARPYSFTAPVVHGKSLGRSLGTPTINQQFPDCKIIPARGVYVTECKVDGACYRAVSNVGVRPTVDSGDSVNCESYLLDFKGDLYGKEITVSFLTRIREERRFSSPEDLSKQIQKDVSAARRY